ncbi:hypothetical protein [Aquabacter spiritensis]|uniref:hypothetical protein n=1 Tax=Aquabacter spiritensis TaxID=933073 RepID=UPI001A9FC202|nr:hypothetical protein [Aquabacter spiritensis]
MATFIKPKSGSWRAQIRRKGQYVNKTFLRRTDAEEWALDMERRIDRREPAVTRRSRDAKRFRDLVALSFRGTIRAPEHCRSRTGDD